MKTTKEIFNELYRPKSPDEQKFVDKHVVDKKLDRNEVDGKVNGDDVFNAKNIKTGSRSKTRHGYDIGQDEKVYEETEELDEEPIKLTKGWGDGGKSKITKEDIINRAIEKYMPEVADATPKSMEERLVDKLSGISESNIHTLLDIFGGLNEDNQYRMIDKADTREGIMELLNFAIESRGK